ncbi:hypothetical protein [Halospeciosus flavus]|nr:hypothetical protein [Halospeciosus flavus]
MANHSDGDIDRLVEEGEESFRAAKEIAGKMYPDAELRTTRYATADDSRHAPEGAWLSGVSLVFSDDTDEETLKKRAEKIQERLGEDNRVLNANVRSETNPRKEVTIEVADYKDPR